MSWDLIFATASLAGALIEWRRAQAGKSRPIWWKVFAVCAIGFAGFALLSLDGHW